MSEQKSSIIHIYQKRTPARELWSDFCTFSVVVGLFGVGWWFDSAAMQWFAFVTCFLILFGRAASLSKKMDPQEAVDFLHGEYGVSPREKDAGN